MAHERAIGAGSLIGGIPETQEMLDFCAERGITSDVEMIAMQDIEQAYERMLASDVKYRFVIDMATLKRVSKAQLVASGCNEAGLVSTPCVVNR